jgi:hypothetical protein
VPHSSMSELEPLKQVKKNHSDFTYRVWSPEEKNLWRWEQRKSVPGLMNKLIQVYGSIDTSEPANIIPGFLCRKCEYSYSIGYWQRCRACVNQRNAHRKSRKWAKLVKKEWLALREKQPRKYKTLKFITLTIKNLETPGGQLMDPQEIKQAVLKPFRKYLKKAKARGWIDGGIYAYEYTNKKTKQTSIDGERIRTDRHGYEDFDERGDSEFVTSHHPHMHIITIGKYVDQEEHLQLWREEVHKTQGSDKAGVHIEAITNPRKSLWYVTEYIKKSSLGGRNREPFGILRGTK